MQGLRDRGPEFRASHGLKFACVGGSRAPDNVAVAVTHRQKRERARGKEALPGRLVGWAGGRHRGHDTPLPITPACGPDAGHCAHPGPSPVRPHDKPRSQYPAPLQVELHGAVLVPPQARHPGGHQLAA